MIDPTLINPYSLFKYTFPYKSFRPIDERKLNKQGYTYDIVETTFGDKFSLPDGKYELRKSENKTDFYFIFDSKDKWTGWNVSFEFTDSEGAVIPYTKPIILTFLGGVGSPKISKKQKASFGYKFFLIDNAYPTYESQSKSSNTIANATVIDSKTGKPIKAKAN
jgi:hypothetical protein